MRKPRTLNECWAACIEMCEWTASERSYYPGLDVDRLKCEWLYDNGYTQLKLNCFFCDWCKGACHRCPARKIDEEFNCMDYDYSYDENPQAFLAKIKALDKIRRKK